MVIVKDKLKFSFKGYLLNPSYPKDSKGGYIFEPVKEVYKQVEECKKYAYLYPGGGTMLISNHKVVKMKAGYQVSFKRPPNELDLLPEEYDEISYWIIRKTGSRLYAGFWGGSSENDPPDTEPSFWTDNEKVALEIAQLFNQQSILIWKNLKKKNKICFKDNIFYDNTGKELNKNNILEKIRKENSK